MSVMSLVPEGFPDPEGFEVALSRKIIASSSSFLHTFQSLDEDYDGYLSKNDLQESLYVVFGIRLDENQIDTIFRKSSVFHLNSSDSSDDESRNDQMSVYSSGGSEDLMTFNMFQKYIYYASSDDSMHPASRMSGGGDMSAKDPLKATRNFEDKKSVASKTKKLRSLVVKAIRQASPSQNAAASIFLQIDTHRDSIVTHAEFNRWLQEVQGIYLTEQDMKLVFGTWVKDEGLNLQEFTYYVDCLLSEYGGDICLRNEVVASRLSFNQRTKANTNDDGKTDKQLIWALLNYFRDIDKSYGQVFDMLDKSGDRRLTPHDVSIGLKQAGLEVSITRSRALLSSFALHDGNVDLTRFVRMMTSKSIPE